MEFLGAFDLGNQDSNATEQPPASAKLTDGSWNQINAAYAAGQPQRNADRLDILTNELPDQTDPAALAALQREIGRAQKDANKPAPTPKPTPAARATELTQAAFEGQDAKKAARKSGKYDLPDTSGPVIFNDAKPEAPAVPAPVDTSKNSSGLWGDTWRELAIGGNELVRDAREVVNQIPGVGPWLVDKIDAADEYWAHAKTEDKLKGITDTLNKQMTPEMQASMAKKWWDDGPGPALTDPRSYWGGVMESLPGTAVTMLPGMVMAKSAYAARLSANLAGGMAKEAAIKSAGRIAAATAGVSGAILEGTQQAGNSGRKVRDDILALPEETLQQSQSYQQLLQTMTPDEARKKIADDSATQAFVMAGVATAAFSGWGDAVLAKMMTAGRTVSTVAAKSIFGRIAASPVGRFGKAAVAEGGMEEGPQSALSAMAENKAKQNANPNQDLMEDVANQTVGGIAVGALQGGGMGLALGHDRKVEPQAAPNPLLTPIADPAVSPAAGGIVTSAPIATSETETGNPVPEPGNTGTNPGNTGTDAGLDTGSAEEEAPAAPTIKATVGQVAGFGRRRALELMAIEDRTPEQESEYEFLTKNAGQVESIANAYGISVVNNMASATGSTAKSAFNQAKTEESAALDGAKAEQDKAVDWLNKTAPQANFVPFRDNLKAAPDDTSRAGRDEARALAQFFGKKLFFFDHKATGEKDFQISGVTANANTILLDAKNENPQRYVFGHELTHAMRKDAPDLYQWLHSEISPVSDMDRWIADWRGKNTDANAQGMSDDKIAEEFIGNVVADRFAEPEFWKGMAERNPSRFKQIADKVLAFIDRIINGKQAKTSDEYLKNAQQDLSYIRSVVSAAVDAYDEHLNQITLDQLSAHGLSETDRAAVDTLSRAHASNPAALDLAAERYADDEAGLINAAQEIIDNEQGQGTDDAGQSAGETARESEADQPVQRESAETQPVDGVAKRADREEERSSAEPAPVAPAVEPAAEAAPAKRAKYATDLPIVEHVTQKGKTLRGVIAPISLAESSKYGTGAFRKNGGTFILEKNIERPTKNTSPEAKPEEVKAVPANDGKAETPVPGKDEAALEETTSETARRGTGYATNHGKARVVEHAKRGDFSVMIGMDSYGTFKMDDAGKISAVKAKAEWMADAVRSAAEQFAKEQNATQEGNQEGTAGNPKAAPQTKKKERPPAPESDQDRSEREWGENYSRVAATDDLSTVSTKDLERADAYASRVRDNENRKGWDGGEVNKVLVESLQREIEQINFELKLRRDKAEKTVTPQLKQSAAEMAAKQETPQNTVDAAEMSKAEVLKALESGQKLTRDGETTWIEETKAGSVQTYVVKSQSDDSNVVITKGPVGPDRQWGWGRNDAAQHAIRSWEFKGETPAAETVDKRETLAADTEKAKAQADLMAGLADLADIFGKNAKLSITPEQEQKLMPVLAKVMDAAFRLGYYKFKDAARFVINTIRDKIGLDVSSQVSLDHLQGSYIAVAGKYKEQGASSKKEVIAVESMDEIHAQPEQGNEPDQGNQPAPAGAPSDTALAGKPAEDVRPAESGRKAGKRSDGSRGQDAQGTSRSGKRGTPAGSSVGDGTGDLFISAGGTGSDAGGAAIGGLQTNASSAEDAQRRAAQSVEAADYRITDLTRLGEGGARTKYANNVAAIRLMKDLRDSGRKATPAEQDVLARYVGWGGLSQVFDPEHKDWTAQHPELKALLTPAEWDAAKESTQYAHYTSQGIIEGIYGALRRLGFTGGKVLEPGSGVGNFVGLMPDAMRNGSRFTGVERESIAAGIAKLLYPNQNIQNEDFTYFNAGNGYFDAVVGNPPFSETKLTDMTGRKHLSGLSIHNYFFAKALDLLRDNGVLSMVVTSSMLDAKGTRAREYIGKRATLLGAIRLPNSAFMGNAGTDVTTDILFLQKLPEAQWDSKAAKDALKGWLDLGAVSDPRGGDPIPINRYFIDHPEMMLGRMERVGGRYREDMAGLVAPKNEDIGALLEKAIAKLPENVFQAAAVANTKAMEAAAQVAIENPDVHVGGYFMREGQLYQRANDVAGESFAVKMTPEMIVNPSHPATKRVDDPVTGKKKTVHYMTKDQTLGEEGYATLVAASNLRSTLRQLIVAESQNDEIMETLRPELNAQYDAFVKQFGYFNDRTRLQLLGDDPDLPLLMSLERDYDPGISDTAAKREGIKRVKPSAKKAPIFERAVIDSRKPVTKADTPADALMISIAERGRIDPSFIGGLLKRDGEEVLKELTKGDTPALFNVPGEGYVLRDEYLSGNVRKKLKQALAMGMDDNARALTEVLPEDIPSHEINGKLGAPWIPTPTYEAFVQALLGEDAKVGVRFVPALNSFNVTAAGVSEVANTNTWGVPEAAGEDGGPGITGLAIIDALMNNRMIRVGSYDKEGKFHLAKAQTDAANDKAQAIRDKFNDWLMADADRAEMLSREYNDKMNNYVVRKFDGSMLTFPGKVSDTIRRYRRHQRNGIARILQEGRALLDHVVGAGKTDLIIGSTMEMKRTGLAKKSLIAVPNHLVKQWAADFYRLYPGANILTATKKDFEKANRRKFLAKIATGDWDAVIIAHSSFGFIKPDPGFEAKFNLERIDEIMKAMQELGPAKGADSPTKRTIKQLAKMKEKLEQRIKTLRDKPMDDLLDFGQLGIDFLNVDEFHMFKNLMFTTKMQNVRGLGQPEGSMRAYDMLIKVRQVTEKNGGKRGIVGATGTPVSNSLAEMYHMLRYLAPETLSDMGHQTFDAWANTFAEVEQVWMQAMSGEGYKATNRMSKFVNTPDLLKAYNQVADTVTIEDIKAAYREENAGREFPIPPLKGGHRTPISIPKSAEQTEYMQEIAQRAKALEQRKGPPKKGDDNMLSILGDARKAAMDIRMVRPEIETRDPGGRIALAAQNVYDTYQAYADVRGTQLVFSDMGTPKKHLDALRAEYADFIERMAPLNDPDLQASADLGDEEAIKKITEAEEAQEEFEAKGQDWMDQATRAESSFSIYDDFKAALLEKGIPENEIAFIHDYNTDDQKAALFRAVNDGKIRILLGSTAKMGAGTNVQERLVEEHHLDVPWKPSDIEQREGRIVRQGNVLIDPSHADYIPNFEVSIKAYATQDTLDLFMWQVQEKKLSMIGQLRSGVVDREFENAFEELQMSAGEMQAAATSNPYLLQEIQLKDKVKKLERKKKSFEGQQNDLITRKKRAEQAIESLPGEIEQLEKREQATAAYRKSMDDRPFAMTINGEAFTDAAEASAKLRELTDTGEDDKPVEGDPAQATLIEKPKRKVMTPLEIDGKEYKSKNAVAEAFRRVAGDADKIQWAAPNGETYIRRADLRTGIIDDAMALAETDDTKVVGHLGDYEISFTGEHDKEGAVGFHVDATLNGEAVGKGYRTFMYPGLAELREKGLNDAIGLADRIVGNAASGLYWAKADLAKAKITLEDVNKQDLNKTWEGAAELDKARADHRAILKQINGAATEQAEEAKPDEPAFMRKDKHDFVDQWESDSGLPVFYGRQYDLMAVDQFNTASDFTHKSLQMGQTAFVQPGNRVFDFLIKDGTGKEVGDAVLQVNRAGHIVAIHDIEIKAKNKGIGTEVVKSILASSRGRIKVIQIVPSAENFWKGVGVNEQDQYNNGTFGWDDFARSDRGRALAMASQPAQQPAGAGPENNRGDGKAQRGIEGSGNQEVGDPLYLRKEFANPLMQKVADNVGDLLTTQKTFNIWNRTVGTQYQKAQQHAGFKRVFDGVQLFMRDTTQLAMQSEAQAPDILPKLDTIKDLGLDLKRMAENRSFDSLKEADRQNLSSTIYGGTLEKRVWSDDEMRNRFGASDQQIKHYRQYLASINDSLNSLAKSEITRLAKLANMPEAGALMDGGVSQAAAAVEAHLNEGARAKLMTYLEDLAKNNFYPNAGFMDRAKEMPSALAIADLFAKEYEPLTDQVAKVNDQVKTVRAARAIEARNNQLQSEGYVPLMRFGRYFIHMTDKETGDTTYFSLFESEREANRMARDLAELNPDMTMEQGITSQEQFKLMKGISPETLALFSDVAGVDPDDMMQQYYRLAVNNNSTLKRLIHRKGTDGYSEDVTRGLASFITSNARRSSANINQSDIDRAAADIKEGDVKDEAIKLKEYVQNPLEEAAGLRGFMFAWFLGGSVASALVNITQPVLMTFPRLSTFGAGKAAKQLAYASGLAAKASTGAKLNLEGDLAAAVKRAQDDGIVAPQEIFQLMATARGAGASSKAVMHLQKLWGAFFSVSESFNRYTTFIAAFNLAKDAGMANPYEYAVNTVYDTQGLYNKGNRPNWGRGAVGATLFTFKQFSIAYLEFLSRLPRKQQLMALALLMLAAGTDGLPFEDDMEDVIDALASKLGYGWNTKAEKRKALAGLIGEAGTNFVTRGISAFLPFDVSGRMSSGNLIPGTGVLSPAKPEKLQEATEALGAVGGLAKAGAAAYKGDFSGALPIAISNLYKGIDIAATGEVRNMAGKKIAEAKPGDALAKIIGFNPNSSAEPSRVQAVNMATLNIQKDKKHQLMNDWVDAIVAKDGAAIARARQAVSDWNKKNGDTMPVLVNPASLSRAVMEKRMTSDQRQMRHAPREMRAMLESADDE